MLVRAIFGVALLAGCVSLAAGDHDTAAPKTPGPDRARTVKERLARLERAAQQAATPARRGLTDEEHAQYVKAAEAFAKAVAGDDEIRREAVFRDAFNVALLARVGATAPRGTDRLHPVVRARAMPAAADRDHAHPHATAGASIARHPEYVKNARKLREDSLKPDSGLFPPSKVRIVGGQPDTGNDFPDCVAVGGPQSYCCTGTLIAPTLVVTAGHCHGCVQNGRVFFGRSISETGTTVKIKAVVRHPAYGTDGEHNDLTLVVLDKAVTVAPRRIADPTVTDKATFVRAVGYGTTDLNGSIGFGTRRLVDLPIASRACSGKDHAQFWGCDPNKEMVAGAKFLDKDTCRGDSGGPIYIRSNGKWFVCGATSRATDAAEVLCGDGGIYARLDRHLEWIRAIAKKHGAKLPE